MVVSNVLADKHPHKEFGNYSMYAKNYTNVVFVLKYLSLTPHKCNEPDQVPSFQN